jgi:hypothetical protein
MVHIIEHRDETPEDFPMEEEATSSTPQSLGRPTPGAAAMRPARRRTPVQASLTPPGIAPAGALSVARELLRYPPSSTASPGAMRQWCDDVDRLLGVAHSSSVGSRPRSSWCQYEASTSVRAALIENLRAELNRRHVVENAQVLPERPGDLRDELNRRRVGKDARISLERVRERHRNLEGHNLGQDFAAVAPQAPGDV